MSRYPTLRLYALKRLAEIVEAFPPDQLETLPAEIRTTSPAEFKALAEPPFDKERFLSFPIPLGFFGWLWSEMTRNGTREIRKVPRDQMMTMRYERLLDDNRAQLTRLAGFIGTSADRQWLDKTAAFVDSGRTGSALAQLDPGELATLRAVCAPGDRAFGFLEAEHMAEAG